MLDFQQKRKFKKMLYSRITLCALLIIVVLLARATWNIYGKEKESAQNYAAVQKSYDSLESQQATLSAQVNVLSSPSGQEEAIREKFSVAKPGETVVMVINASNSPSARNPSEASLWQRFLDIF